MKKITYGLMIWPETKQGPTRYVTAEVFSREGDWWHNMVLGADWSRRCDQPLGISSNDQYRAYRDNEPKHLVGLQMQGLGMYGFVSAEFCSSRDTVNFIGYNIEYRHVYSIDAEDAARMGETFKVIQKRLTADEAHEPGDMFASLCAALRLSWVCERTSTSPNRRYSEWRFMTPGEGRNRYRRLIDEAVTAARTEKFGAEQAA